MRIAITGGLGFIGKRLASAFVQRGDEVLLLDLPRFGAVEVDDEIGDSVDVELFDIVEDDGLGEAFEGADAVVHAAALHQVDDVRENPIRALEVNVSGTRIALNAAAEAKVGRVVNLSSAKVYGELDGGPSRESDIVRPAEQYGVAKVVGEGYCGTIREMTDMELISLRPFSVYGPGQSLNTGYIGALLRTLSGKPQVALPGRPDFTRDFVHVDAVVDACLYACDSDAELPRLLNVGSGSATSLADLVTTFEKVTERPLEVTYVEPRAGTISDTLADTTLLQQLVDPKPIDLDEGLAETVAATLAHAER